MRHACARNGGCFHPNCTHTLEYVDEVADKDEIDLQKSHPVTGDAADADAQDERRYEIDQARKMRDEGLTAEQARVAVDRDNLEASIRNGLIRADAKDIVAKMTDAQVTRLCPNGNPPAFEPVKRVRGGTRKEPKYEPERWNHGKRGGVVHVKADADMAHILSVCKVDAQQTPAPAPTHAPTTRKTNANAPVAASKDKDEWKPTTALERATDALMSSIGVKHTDERLAIDGVNPNFDMTRQELSNKGLRTDAWTSNCQRCVPAYEMRLRGYDVTSNPFDGNRDGVRFFKDAFADAQVCRGGRRFKVDADAIVSSSPDGSRFLVRIKWEHGGAHFFMARKIGGNVIYEDPQDPTRNAANHFNSAGTGRGENWILRIDNREITQDIADAISIV